ncbi:MAG: hypothetical protein Q9178_007158 [Gyalolechia marmorata]
MRSTRSSSSKGQTDKAPPDSGGAGSKAASAKGSARDRTRSDMATADQQPSSATNHGGAGQAKGAGGGNKADRAPRKQDESSGSNDARTRHAKGGPAHDMQTPEESGHTDQEEIDEGAWIEEQQRPVTEPSERFIPPSEGSSKAQSRGRGGGSRGSPRRGKTLDKSRPDTNIDVEYLEFCSPSVHLQSRDVAIRSGTVPPMVVALDDALHPELTGYIPRRLKPLFAGTANTPRKSQRKLPDHKYLPETDTSIPDGFGQSMKATAEAVVRSKKRNDRMQAHERQWGNTTVIPLLHEVLKWPQSEGAMELNLESCPIEPLDIRMRRPGNGSLIDETKSKVSAADETEMTTTRMVDVALGLDLSIEDRKSVTNGWAKRGITDYAWSLNQSLSYIKMNPLFLDMELKKADQTRDPLVQLGMWMAGLFEKRRHHGWDQSVPMPGLVIDGPQWSLYIGYARDDGVVMMACEPLRFGSTEDIAGTFEIIYKLNILLQWGLNQYKAWFDKYILGWLRGDAELLSCTSTMDGEELEGDAVSQ